MRIGCCGRYLEPVRRKRYHGSGEDYKTRSFTICTPHQILSGLPRTLVGKLERKRPFGIPRRRLEDNIKMALQIVGRGGYGLDWSGSGKKQVAGSCECGNEPSGSTECEEFLHYLVT
jgi:hypothetical protein